MEARGHPYAIMTKLKAPIRLVGFRLNHTIQPTNSLKIDLSSAGLCLDVFAERQDETLPVTPRVTVGYKLGQGCPTLK